MTKWQDFLLEHANFLSPPDTDESESASSGSADVSDVEAGYITQSWRAKYAMRDETLVEILCQTLKMILGDATIGVPQDTLSSLFGRRLGFLPSSLGGEHEVHMWTQNKSEIQVQNLDPHSQMGNP